MKRFFSALILFAVALGGFMNEGLTVGAKTFVGGPYAQRGNLAIRFAPKQISETSKKQRYSIRAKYPQAIGAGRDLRLAKLNQELRDLINKEVSDFKKDFQPPDEPMGSMESTYNSEFWVNLATTDLVSIGFGVSTYAEGAAHPNHHTLSFNYDLRTGRILNLSDLFNPGSNYLSVISSYAIRELKKKLGPDPDTDWIENGASAKEENYKAWGLTRTGLQVTFDPYQVASYAEGQHVVVVPYSVLKNMFDPKAPLPAFTGQQKGIRK